MIEGGCLCGKIRFKVSTEPLGARFCWCRDCQRIASGSATVNALFNEIDVEYTGEMTKLKLVAESNNTVERGFCPECGAQMYSRTVTGPDVPMRIRLGTLDDPEIVEPSAIIWGDSAPSWAPLSLGMPIHSKGPDSPLSKKRQA